MRPAARLQAAIELLDEIIIAARDNGASADNLAKKFFAVRRYAGSKDRRAIRDLTWDAIRHFGERPQHGRTAFVALADQSSELAGLFDGSSYGPAKIALAEPRALGGPLPAWILPHFPEFLNTAEQVALLQRAPLDLRINTLKTDRASVLAEIEESVVIDALPNAIRLSTGTAMDQHPLMQDGSVDIQDLGSQLIATACQVTPGMMVLDLCAGTGGKSLALAADMANTGRLVAADTNRNRLDQIAPRAAHAGVTNVEARLLNPGREAAMLDDIAGSCDVVLVDAPCSGSGTWRRNPETRWRLDSQRLRRVVAEQAKILDIATSMVAPSGHLLYAVCSLLDDEGARQLDGFLRRHGGWKTVDINAKIGRKHGGGLLLTPAHDGSDGFFLARLEKL
jgi:16S rRNA (cytosine967-C5)-methyltransferase